MYVCVCLVPDYDAEGALFSKQSNTSQFSRGFRNIKNSMKILKQYAKQYQGN